MGGQETSIEARFVAIGGEKADAVVGEAEGEDVALELGAMEDSVVVELFGADESCGRATGAALDEVSYCPLMTCWSIHLLLILRRQPGANTSTNCSAYDQYSDYGYHPDRFA